MRDVCSLFSAFFMFLVNANHLSFFIRHKFKICSKQKITKNFSKELKFWNYRKQHRNRTFDFECWCKIFCRWKKKVLFFRLYLVHKVLLWNYLDQPNCTVIENTIICHITWESFPKNQNENKFSIIFSWIPQEASWSIQNRKNQLIA